MSIEEQVALILSNMPVFPAMCSVNAQRACLVAAGLELPILYCEGSVKVGPFILAHAWNCTPDGLIIDLTLTLGMRKRVMPQSMAAHYTTQITLDWQGVLNHRKQHKGWVGDPYKYGEVCGT